MQIAQRATSAWTSLHSVAARPCAGYRLRRRVVGIGEFRNRTARQAMIHYWWRLESKSAQAAQSPILDRCRAEFHTLQVRQGPVDNSVRNLCRCQAASFALRFAERGPASETVRPHCEYCCEVILASITANKAAALSAL